MLRLLYNKWRSLFTRQRNSSTSLFIDEAFNKDLPAKHTAYASWRRPPAVDERTVFFDETVCMCDLKQNVFGNCYYVSALHVLIYYINKWPHMKPFLFNIVRPWQTFEPAFYDGKFGFDLWTGRQYERVYVDDELPCVNGTFAATHCAHGEMWPALLEKAIIKYLGRSYADWDGGGLPHIVLSLLLPGTFQAFDLRRTLYPLEVLARKDTLFNCSVRGSPEELLANGLVCQHAYGLHEYWESSGHVLVHNPWSNHVEYMHQTRGITASASWFCDNCKKATADDGMFVMEEADFLRQFDYIYTYHINLGYLRAQTFINEARPFLPLKANKFCIFLAFILPMPTTLRVTFQFANGGARSLEFSHCISLPRTTAHHSFYFSDCSCTQLERVYLRSDDAQVCEFSYHVAFFI